MRKIVVSCMISLDGFIGNNSKSANVLPNGGEDIPFHTYNETRLRAASTILAGKESYKIFEKHWPPVESDKNAKPLLRRISKYNNTLEKVVVSDTLKIKQDSPWFTTTQIIKDANRISSIKKLKQKPGKDIIIFGSPTLWNDLLEENLVDDIYLLIAPVILLHGLKGFKKPVEQSFKLVNTKRLPGSEIMLPQYAV